MKDLNVESMDLSLALSEIDVVDLEVVDMKEAAQMPATAASSMATWWCSCCTSSSCF